MAKEFQRIYFEPFMQIRHSSLLFYSLPTGIVNYNRHALTHKTYSGKVTVGAQRRIKKAVDLLLQLSPPRWITNQITNRQELHTLSFITLTIPGKEKHLSASEGHKLLLAPWLLKMKRKAGLTTYIWKAEFQKNGQLHYHITTPAWIPYTLIKEEWNNLLSKNELLVNWFKEHPEKFPNSTDVHKVYKVQNIGAYLMKYLSKSEQNKETTGKVWDCSMNLKCNKNFSVTMDSKLFYLWDYKELQVFDRFSVLKLNDPCRILPPKVVKEYKAYLAKIKSNTQ